MIINNKIQRIVLVIVIQQTWFHTTTWSFEPPSKGTAQAWFHRRRNGLDIPISDTSQPWFKETSRSLNVPKSITSATSNRFQRRHINLEQPSFQKTTPEWETVRNIETPSRETVLSDTSRNSEVSKPFSSRINNEFHRRNIDLEETVPEWSHGTTKSIETSGSETTSMDLSKSFTSGINKRLHQQTINLEEPSEETSRSIEGSSTTESISTTNAILWWPKTGLNQVEQVYKSCEENNNVIGCLKNKAANAFERILSQNLTLAEGFVLAKNNRFNDDSITLNDTNLDPDLRISNAIKRLLETHTFILDLSKYNNSETERSEARGKDKKKKKKLKKMIPAVIMACMAMMAMMGPIAVKSLYMIAGHAFLASKIALVISGMVALKKMFSSDQKDTTLHIHAEDDRRRLVDLHGWDDEFKTTYPTQYQTGPGGYSNSPYSSSYMGNSYNSRVMYNK